VAAGKTHGNMCNLTLDTHIGRMALNKRYKRDREWDWEWEWERKGDSGGETKTGWAKGKQGKNETI